VFDEEPKFHELFEPFPRISMTLPFLSSLDDGVDSVTSGSLLPPPPKISMTLPVFILVAAIIIPPLAAPNPLLVVKSGIIWEDEDGDDRDEEEITVLPAENGATLGAGAATLLNIGALDVVAAAVTFLADLGALNEYLGS